MFYLKNKIKIERKEERIYRTLKKKKKNPKEKRIGNDEIRSINSHNRRKIKVEVYRLYLLIIIAFLSILSFSFMIIRIF